MKITLRTPEQFATEFIEHFLSRGLGGMTKRDVEILVIHLLGKHTEQGAEKNHSLSLRLRINETRLRALRYEACLRYPPEDSRYFERQLLYVLVFAQFQSEKKQIVFALEDEYLRRQLQGRLKEQGSFADSSFNTEIVKVPYKQLLLLLYEIYGEVVTKPLADSIESIISGDEKNSYRVIWNNFALGAARRLGAEAVVFIKAAIASYAASC